ncbi:Vmc-like lipoprotein signal peptide domain-containing protein [Mycoplasma bradburyae]|uniref:Haemagglutinin Mycoplasma domain-containing protein n=1 Tax=Mycoplasma bradburyae TaxID=2963128 RepID=A0AAW6HPA6_9MOLU|nr:hypothetical protein [Mycoplasma bradburyae]MDC4183466.1 hypothetical protein [Mycoplasma bradburyae]UTS70527.1 hypothetical protein NMG77_02120 [Mycoplasma bradburyae]
MKQKTKKLLQLSFSLGFLATTALVATSCNQPKTVTPKPTNPMQPGNGSGAETTTPGSGETMQPGNGSGSGTTTPDNSEAKNQLDIVINAKDANLALYSDYSMIKSELTKAYEAAKSVSDKTNASKEELASAKTTLEVAINKAKTDKTDFDSKNTNLVSAYTALKDKLTSKESDLAMITDDKYLPIKNHLDNLYNQVSTIISNTLQADPKPSEENLTQLKTNIESVINKLDEEKDNINQYSNFKLFAIDNNNFKGDLKYNKQPLDSQSLVGFSSDFDNSVPDNQWRYAKRIIKNITPANESFKHTNVSWIYSLDSQDNAQTLGSYDITFKYYGGPSAKLYFPYKASKNSDTQMNGTSNNKLSLKYKLNGGDFVNIDVSNAKVDSIDVAEVNLDNLNFGENVISFSTEMNKTAPMIGNIYISSSDADKNGILNDIFGNKKDEHNPNKITVNFVEGYALGNKAYGVSEATILTKLNGKLDEDVMSKDYYLIGYLGKGASNNNNQDSNIRYYTFYVNAPKAGMYEISGIYNSGENRSLSFSKDRLNNTESNSKAVFTTPKHGEWDQNKLKTFNAQNNKVDNQPTKLQLTKGLNKIIVSGKENNNMAPNLGNVTFTFKETVAPTGGGNA